MDKFTVALTKINGIGDTEAALLVAAGVNTIPQLRQLSSEALAEIVGSSNRTKAIEHLAEVVKTTANRAKLKRG